MTYKEQAKQWENNELNRYLDTLDEDESEDPDIPYNDNYDCGDYWDWRDR